MKTFATLALLGLASAIKLKQNGSGSEEQVEISILAKDFAQFMMDICDTDGDGKCTVEEQEEAFYFSWIDLFADEMTETELAGFKKMEEIYTSADLSDYNLDSDYDGFVTLEDLELEIQYQFDHNNFMEWLVDIEDDVMGNADDQIWH